MTQQTTTQEWFCLLHCFICSQASNRSLRASEFHDLLL